MKNMTTTILLGLGLVSGATWASESTYSPGIDHRQQHQQQRIVQGVKSAQLTARETFRLEKQQLRIHKKERRFKADDVLNRKERVRLHQGLNHSSRSIYRQKHDAQRRGKHQPGIKSPAINKRQHRQFRRIGQGVRSGELTARETRRLGQQQFRIQKQKRYFKSDGRFTRGERFRVHHNQNRASRNIFRKKHNLVRR